jgi:type I restriction enzyme, S subunit
MGEWKEYRLDEVAEITSSKRIFYSEYVSEGIPFYRSKEIIDLYNNRNISTELFISENRYNDIKLKYGVPQEDDILLTSVGSIGIPYLVKNTDKFYFKDGNLTWMRNINKNIILPQYFILWICSNIGKQKLDEVTIGSTQPALTISGLKTIEIELPSIEEQKRITSVISSLDDKIDLLHQENKTLEAMAETLFRKWFIEDAKEEWEDGIIADLIDFNPHRKLSKGNKSPFLEMSNLNTSTYCPKTWRDREFMSGTKFINGDALLARITPCLENGKTAYVDFLEEGQVGWGSTEFIVMRAKHGLHPFFSYIIAKYQDFRDFAESCMAGSSGRQRVDINNLMNYEIKIPEKKVIDVFNHSINYMVTKMHNNNDEIYSLTQIRNILSFKLMNNE